MYILHILLICTLNWKLVSSYKDCGALSVWGNKCENKCRCVSDNCQREGHCGSGARCDPSWFGYKCQFKNVASEYAYSEAAWLLDQNRFTCQPDPYSKIVGISFVREIPFTWLKLSFTQQDTFNITFNFDTLPCSSQRVSSPYYKELDVVCGVPTEIGHIFIHGEIVKYLCDVEVYGGENVAIPQSSEQSSDLNSDRQAYLAHDGIYSINMKYLTCTHTDHLIRQKGYWKLYYSQPVYLQRINIYNRLETEEIMERLMYFVLKLYDAKDQLVYAYHEPGYRLSSYNISVSHITTPIRQIFIQTNSYTNILSLCEVETFGDYICPDGKWGTWCDQNCKCLPQQSCFQPTGACLLPCPAGFHGLGCDKKCSDKCDARGCSERTGDCFGCADGFTGPPACDTVCPHGKYGKDCLLSCSESCQGGECHHLTGGCLNCPDGYFGTDCTQLCPGRCADDKCYSQDGKCLSCSVGLYMDQCNRRCIRYCNDSTCNQDTGYCRQDCPQGFYGEKCVSKCLNRCDYCNNDQKCLKCSRGFVGTNCTDVCPESCKEFICDPTRARSVQAATSSPLKILATIFIIAIIVVIALSVLGFLYFRGI